MNNTTRIAASILGVYAGLLGAEHGIFEILQGSQPTGGLLINAIGPPCQPQQVWHACLPALTFLPTFFWSGILAVLLGISLVLWSLFFVQHSYGAVVQILLSLLFLLVGGGFVPTFIGMIAGAAGSRIHAPLSWGRARPPAWQRFLAALWPWTAFVLLIWFPGSWILGAFFNQAMLDLVPLLFFTLDLGLPLIIVFSAMANDIQESC